MYSSLIIVFFLLLSVMTAFVIAKICDKNFIKFKIFNNDDGLYKITKMPFSKTFFIFGAIFVLFVAVFMIMLLFAISFNKLNIFIVLQFGIFIFLFILTFYYALQKNLLRLENDKSID